MLGSAKIGIILKCTMKDPYKTLRYCLVISLYRFFFYSNFEFFVELKQKINAELQRYNIFLVSL